MINIREGDFLAGLQWPEISVTGAVTATISRMHVCSGTSADYTVTLPAASGNTGKLIGFRMATGLTKLVTIDGNASETIDGATARVMWANEAAILLCDGSNWFKVAGKSIPMLARMALSADQTGIVTATTTKILLNRTDLDNTGMMCDPTTNNQITIKRNGNYQLMGKGLLDANNPASVRLLVNIYLTNTSGTQLASAEIGLHTVGMYATAIAQDLSSSRTAGDVILLSLFHACGSNQAAYGASGGGGCSLVVQEVPGW